MQTISEFIEQHKITMTVAPTDTNPHMDNSARMDHWRCIVKRPSAKMAIIFSMGSGHHGAEPELKGVLDCLASDAAGIENAQSFEDWASEYGYDTDSRKAERTFRACEKQAAKLKAFLGDEAYQSLLFDCERE